MSIQQRIRTLSNHGIKFVVQDGEIYAVGDVNTRSGFHTWENVTACNLAHWLGY